MQSAVEAKTERLAGSMKVLILADVPGWIVDRVTDRLIAGLPEIAFIKRHYACIETDELLTAAAGCDLIHYQNWDIERHWPRILNAGKPVLMSVRSHRFPPYVRKVAKQVHVHAVSPLLACQFDGAHCIPDGIDDHFFSPFRVGYAGKDDGYKGVDLIRQACAEIGAEFAPVFGEIPAADMPAYYRSVDVLACASVDEGFGAPVMEALAMGRRVVSARCGAAWCAELPGITWVDRTVAGIKRGLLDNWPARAMDAFRWPVVCAQFRRLYGAIA